MKHTINVPDHIQYEDLEIEIQKGAQFIAYSYCISLGLVTLKRISKAYFILPNENHSKFRKKYNRLILFFGWWAIPYGPIYSMKYLSKNNQGGLDVTNDIMLNINSDDFEKRTVDIQLIHDLFTKPDKQDHPEFEKVFLSLEYPYKISTIVVGLYCNTGEYEAPFYVVGFKPLSDVEECKKLLNTALYKRFRKHVYFELLDLSNPSEVADEFFMQKLVEQGYIYKS